ncbi:MAG TPA: hypothetical protein VFQ58_01165, partial [Flavisolibacter sp.]|nr:hypothetical protein [Flavisolibacter sp.]
MRQIIHFAGNGSKPIYFIILLLLLLSACQKNNKEVQLNQPALNNIEGKKKNITKNADVAIDWYNLQLRIILNAHPAYANPVTIRVFSFTGITLYEAVHNMIDHAPGMSRLLYQAPTLPKTNDDKNYFWPEAANAALAYMTKNLFPALTDQNKGWIDSLENYYDLKFNNFSGPSEFKRSQAYGRAVASAIYVWSKTDKFDLANALYAPPVFPGAWVPTPPAFANAAVPYLGNVRPFMQIHLTGLTPPPPFAYSEDPSSDFYGMVKDLYDVSKNLTADQRNIALYWNDVGAGVGYTPSGHAISILNQILVKENTGLAKAAQLFAKTGIGMWDGTIMCWRSKYAFNQLRPVTYIKNIIDNSWVPLIATPPHPEYPAAHAFITSSSMV